MMAWVRLGCAGACSNSNGLNLGLSERRPDRVEMYQNAGERGHPPRPRSMKNVAQTPVHHS
jgi:hypothetical protein